MHSGRARRTKTYDTQAWHGIPRNVTDGYRVNNVATKHLDGCVEDWQSEEMHRYSHFSQSFYSVMLDHRMFPTSIVFAQKTCRNDYIGK